MKNRNYLKRKATSASTGFHAGPLSRSNWNLGMLVFKEGGKPENPKKNPRSEERTNNKLNPQWRRAGIEPPYEHEALLFLMNCLFSMF